MEARSVDSIPRGAEWQYEPKWDGFRCLLSRQGDQVDLRSKSGEDLARYFPELVQAALALKATAFLLDGEIVVPHGKAFSFDDLLQRIHPAASRVKKLSQETPALFLAFDLLASTADNKLAASPLRERRPALEAFAKAQFKSHPTFRLSPASTSYATAQKWLKRSGGGSDDDAGQVSSASKGEKLKEEMDDILDEIDSVLEENAEEFVKSYVQKGGE